MRKAYYEALEIGVTVVAAVVGGGVLLAGHRAIKAIGRRKAAA
jgi:hypothetical protein